MATTHWHIRARHLAYAAAALGGVAAAAYWLLIIGEGTYLGRRFVRLVYQLGAPHYDRVRGFPSPDDQRILAPLLWAALPATPALVVDVATGTGRAGYLLATAPDFAGHVLGVDYAPAMLQQAVARSRADERAGSFLAALAEAGSLPLPSAACDMAICLEALEYFPHPRQALGEMVQVLRPGGVLVLSKFTDGWARLLPARAFSRRAMRLMLGELGMAPVAMLPWQPGNYELIFAVKQE